MIRVARRLTAVLLCWASAGCFVYVPVELGQLPQEAPVRVRVTPAAALRLVQTGAAQFDQPNDPTLWGSLVLGPGDRLAIRVPLVAAPGGAGSDIFQELVLSRDEILQVAGRRLSSTRSVLAATAAVGLGAATFVLIVNGSTGEPRLPGPGGPNDVRLPRP
jgi:hypothetical protein